MTENVIFYCIKDRLTKLWLSQDIHGPMDVGQTEGVMLAARFSSVDMAETFLKVFGKNRLEYRIFKIVVAIESTEH